MTVSVNAPRHSSTVSQRRIVNCQISAYLRRLTTAQARYMFTDELQIILVEMFLFTRA